ncbi:MAG: hypothetical protein IPN43_09390 [Chitinophagaceae bacterium]|nr:hypothetical protein [Chitinophagaceae bacterium]
MADSEEIQNQIDKCEPLIVNYNIFDTTLINTVAQLVAESVSLVLDYALYNDDDKIINCSENNLEILNQIKSDEYRLNINPDATRMEVQSFLVPIFEREIETQEKIIDYIKIRLTRKLYKNLFKSKIQ